MREITFKWKGEDLVLVPSMSLLSRLAVMLRKETEGLETTVGLAYRCINGGAEPMFLVLVFRAFLAEALKSGTPVPSLDEIYDRLSTHPAEALAFRTAYAEAILPNVSLGKGPAAPSSAGEAAAPSI